MIGIVWNRIKLDSQIVWALITKAEKKQGNAQNIDKSWFANRIIQPIMWWARVVFFSVVLQDSCERGIFEPRVWHHPITVFKLNEYHIRSFTPKLSYTSSKPKPKKARTFSCAIKRNKKPFLFLFFVCTHQWAINKVKWLK